MPVLIDTNVLLDFLNKRTPYNTFADKIIELCSDGVIKGCIASISIPNIFYIMRKDLPIKKLRELLIDLCDVVDVIGIDKQNITEALLKENFSDFEDCLQIECAKRANADYIITRNLADFADSPIPAISSEDFLKKVE